MKDAKNALKKTKNLKKYAFVFKKNFYIWKIIKN